MADTDKEKRNTQNRDADYGDFNITYDQVRLLAQAFLWAGKEPNLDKIEDAAYNPKIMGFIPADIFSTPEERELALKAAQEGVLDAYLTAGKNPPEGLARAVEVNLRALEEAPSQVPNEAVRDSSKVR